MSVQPQINTPDYEHLKWHLFLRWSEWENLAYTYCGYVAPRQRTIKPEDVTTERVCRRCCPRPELLPNYKAPADGHI